MFLLAVDHSPFCSGKQQTAVKPSAALSMIQLQDVDDVDAGSEAGMHSDNGNDDGEYDASEPGEGLSGGEAGGSDRDGRVDGEQQMFVGGQDGGFEEDIYGGEGGEGGAPEEGEHELYDDGEVGVFEEAGREFEGEEGFDEEEYGDHEGEQGGAHEEVDEGGSGENN